jgi:hypothetical protein
VLIDRAAFYGSAERLQRGIEHAEALVSVAVDTDPVGDRLDGLAHVHARRDRLVHVGEGARGDAAE